MCIATYSICAASCGKCCHQKIIIAHRGFISVEMGRRLIVRMGVHIVARIVVWRNCWAKFTEVNVVDDV